MGWFDDDDEEEKPKPAKLLIEDIENSKPSGDGEEEDPLDAYMKSLAQAKEETKPRSARLDVENEEEATGHWELEKGSTATLQEEKDLDPQGDEASLAMQQMFHKASNSGQQEHRQVNIQLDKIEHANREYAPFRKAFMSHSDTQSTSQGHAWRREHATSCHPPLDPIFDFAELRDVLPTEAMEWIVSQGMTKPTLVQSQTMGVALSGLDAIVTASTGSGKTLAYLWPMVTHLVENNQQQNTSRALVLVPTRELALQVEKVARSLLAKLPYKALAITGGNMGRYQLSQTLLKNKPHLVVATPGRLLDVLSAQQKSKQEWLLREISFLVLDEADKMLQLGFAPQVSQVLDSLRPDRQSLLTSATLQSRLERHCQEWMNSPTRISVGRTGQSSEHVDQHVLCLPSNKAKESFLLESLPTFCDVGRTLVFCATREGCEKLAQMLTDAMQGGLQTLHGDKHPSDRKAALRAFAKGQVRLLIATDVAGRGLDIPKVATVINYDPAKNWDTHVHRIGRAGRLSSDDGGQRQRGTAYTLLTPHNAEFAQTLVLAHEREGRAADDDVRKLALQSKQSTAGMGRKGSNAGLGFDDSKRRKVSRWS